MNPVSTRGRSMPRDRRTFRAVVVAMGILGAFVSTGCLRSPMLRPSDGPAPRPSASTDPVPDNPPAAASGPALHGATSSANGSAPPASPAVTPGPSALTSAAPLELQAAPTPLEARSAEGAATPVQTQPASPPTTPPAAAPPEAPSTPLLDAAIERVAAIRGDQRDSLDLEPSPAVSDEPKPRNLAPASRVAVAPRAPVKKPEPVVRSETTGPEPAVLSTLIKCDDVLPPNLFSPAPKRDVSQPPAKPPVKPDTPTVPGPVDWPKEKRETPLPIPPASSDTYTSLPATVETDLLAIGKLCMCRAVHGFGVFEACPGSHAKVGQRIVIYCEMTGMKYEVRDASFVSRLSSKIEISAAASGEIEWARELGPAEDVCASRRRDFYVNYRVELPSSLLPGSYRLRLTQTDLVASRTTSAELPFEIVP